MAEDDEAYSPEALEPGQDDVIKRGGPGLFARAKSTAPRTPTDEYLYTDHEPALRGIRHGVRRFSHTVVALFSRPQRS